MGKYVMSSGHGKKVSGANGFLNEVTEARRVVKQVVKYLKELGETVYEFHDDTSTTQAQNLRTIVTYHNGKNREKDFSVHFNAFNGKAGGVEVLHYDSKNKKEAAALSKVIAKALDLEDRGAKERGKSLAFLRDTNKPALLIEICFVDNKEDAEKYNKNFDKVCRAIAEHIAGKKLKEDSDKKPATTTKKPEANNDTNYRIVAGSFSSKDLAQKQVAELKKKGIDSFIDTVKK